MRTVLKLAANERFGVACAFIRRRTLMVLVALPLAPCAVRADTSIWDQPAFGVFHSGSSWQGGVAPGPDDQAVMGATLTTVFNPITSLFLVDTDVAFTDVVAGDYTFDDGNPGVQHTTQFLRIGMDTGPWDPGLPDTAFMRIDGMAVEVINEAYIGNDGQFGSLRLDGPTSSLNAGVGLWVGPSAVGAIEVVNGASVSGGFINAGGPGSPTSSGEILVDGPGTSLLADGALEIGRDHVGSLTVSNGASVAAGFASAGTFLEGDGAIVLDGPGTSLSSAGALEIGRDGVGTLTVSNGAQVIAGFTSAGTFAYPGTQGSITVEGAGTLLEAGGSLDIGRDAVGSLTVRDGAAVTAAFATAGTNPQPTANGSIILDGTGSQLNIENSVEIGRYAPGSLDITGQAEFMTGAGISFVGTHTGSDGSVAISGTNNGQRSQWVASDSIYLGFYGGTGTVDVSDGGLLAVGYELNIAATSMITVSGSSFVTVGNANLISGAVSIGQGNRLSGGGTINGDVVNDGGTVAPDGSAGGIVGLLSISGNFSQSSSATLLVELGGQSPGAEYDKVSITGDAGLDGTLVVALNSGYTPPTGATFDILSANMIADSFTSVYLPSLAADQRWHLAYGLQVVSLTVVAAADLDNDGDVDLDDLASFTACLQGPGIPPAPGCELADIDVDGDVDLLDFARLQTAFGG